MGLTRNALLCRRAHDTHTHTTARHVADEPDELACDEDSNCTNRMMQIECEIGACRCGDGELKCANQRYGLFKLSSFMREILCRS